MLKPEVLIFADYFAPGFLAGGPIRSLMALVDNLQPYFAFTVITRNHDFKQTKCYPLPVNQPIAREGYTVYYVTQENISTKYFKTLITKINPSCIYLNSFFSRQFSQMPLRAARQLGLTEKVVLAPRGEFSPGALAIKQFKKSLFINITKSLGYYQGIRFQATADGEAEHIHLQLPDNSIFRANNLFSCNPTPSECFPTKQPEHLSCVYLSRITAKKNLLGTLQLLNKVQHSLSLDIYGPQEDAAYWQQCAELISAMPAHIQITYRGNIDGASVVNTLSRYDVMLLLTHGENFGHAIAEALQAGCPTLLSDQTPWHNTSDQVNYGLWDYSLDDEHAFLTRLAYLAKQDNNTYNQLRLAAQNIALQAQTADQINQYQALFAQVNNKAAV